MTSLQLCAKAAGADATIMQAQRSLSWAAKHNLWLLIELTPQGVVFSFLFSSLF